MNSSPAGGSVGTVVCEVLVAEPVDVEELAYEVEENVVEVEDSVPDVTDSVVDDDVAIDVDVDDMLDEVLVTRVPLAHSWVW